MVDELEIIVNIIKVVLMWEILIAGRHYGVNLHTDNNMIDYILSNQLFICNGVSKIVRNWKILQEKTLSDHLHIPLFKGGIECLYYFIKRSIWQG